MDCAAAGLHYLHNMQPNPILHLDLKTSNVLLDQHGNAKLGELPLLQDYWAWVTPGLHNFDGCPA